MRLFDILKTQGRSIAWLARETGYSANYLYQLKMGVRPITEPFVERVVRVMQLPEDVLFLPSELTEVRETLTESSTHELATC